MSTLCLGFLMSPIVYICCRRSQISYGWCRLYTNGSIMYHTTFLTSETLISLQSSLESRRLLVNRSLVVVVDGGEVVDGGDDGRSQRVSKIKNLLFPWNVGKTFLHYITYVWQIDSICPITTMLTIIITGKF